MRILFQKLHIAPLTDRFYKSDFGERKTNKSRERDQVRSVFCVCVCFTSESQGGHERSRGAGNHRCRNFLDDLMEAGEIGQKTQKNR